VAEKIIFMLTPQVMQSMLQPLPVIGRFLNFILYAVLSMYIVFVQGTDADAISLERLLFRHEQLLSGTSEFFNPWQYRILSTWVIESVFQIVHSVSPEVGKIYIFIVLRVLQSMLILTVANAYYTSLGIRNPLLRAAGILILGFGMANSVYHSDLSFGTYNDILFYLVSCWLILNNKIVWLIPVTFFAAMNRETSALIPLLAAIPHIHWQDKSFDRKAIIVAAACALVYLIVWYGLRLYFGFQPPAIVEGMQTPMDYLRKNFGFLRTYPLIAGTLGFVPIIVVLFFARLPRILKLWFWAMVPIWFIVHFSFSKAAESRLFLVPQAVIFIPAFLWLIEGWREEPERAPQENRQAQG
jgi:hypothetical protein